VKKRTGFHESTIREITLRAGGIEVSEPLAGFNGVLTGTPVYAPPNEPRGA
jgi:circadian clock protein KaiC